MFSSREIQSRVQSGYIERVGVRLKKMRKQLMNRDWIGLKDEANHLAEGANNFGYIDIAGEVQKAIDVLNTRHLSKMAVDPDAKLALESLFQRLDRFLVDHRKAN